MNPLVASASACSTSARCPLPSVRDILHHRPSGNARRHGCGATLRRSAARRGGAGSVAARASGGGEGSFYDSEIVQQESSSIMNDYEQMMRLLPKFAGFDLDGKRIFLDKMDELCERLKIFNFRAKNSDDPTVQQFLTGLGKQLLYMNTNLDSIYEGMRQQSQQLRELVDAEERITDPQQLAAFRQKLQSEMGAASAMQDALAKNLSVEKMMEDPSVMQTMMSNPQALKALSDVAEGGPAAAERYRDQPELYRVLCKVFEL